ncbi:hypothetical protein F5879DRAFT_927331 [Lentinula edodes]|nr:hypothetical protein F5879DRAFT_927331 [Lentinula edodes]
MFGHLPPSPPLTELLGTKIRTGFYEPLASQAVTGIVLNQDQYRVFYEPLASQAVAGIVLCATCDLTYPVLLFIMFGHLPPSPPLTELLGTKIGTGFYEPLASQAVAGIVLCATCNLTYPALFSIMFGHLPPSPPLTASLGTTIGTGFHEPLASQAVAGIALCATGNLTYPALLSIMFGHLPPSPPFTELLEPKIGTGFDEPLASQAVAGIVLCVTCHLAYPALLFIMFGHLPPSPPLTELLGTKIGTEFHQPLASQAVAGIVLCATCNLTYPALFSIMFGHLPPSPPLTESLETKIKSLGTKIRAESFEPLPSQPVPGIVMHATCQIVSPALCLTTVGDLPCIDPRSSLNLTNPFPHKDDQWHPLIFFQNQSDHHTMPSDQGSHGPPSADFTDKGMVSESPQDIKAIQRQNADKETLLEIRRQIAKNAFPTGQLDLQHVLEASSMGNKETNMTESTTGKRLNRENLIMLGPKTLSKSSFEQRKKSQTGPGEHQEATYLPETATEGASRIENGSVDSVMSRGKAGEDFVSIDLDDDNGKRVNSKDVRDARDQTVRKRKLEKDGLMIMNRFQAGMKGIDLSTTTIGVKEWKHRDYLERLMREVQVKAKKKKKRRHKSSKKFIEPSSRSEDSEKDRFEFPIRIAHRKSEHYNESKTLGVDRRNQSPEQRAWRNKELTCSSPVVNSDRRQPDSIHTWTVPVPLFSASLEIVGHPNLPHVA